MAHKATVLTHNDLARLCKLRDSLSLFVARLTGETKAAGETTAPKKRNRKPTGAAAHKKYLAKKQATPVAPEPAAESAA